MWKRHRIQFRCVACQAERLVEPFFSFKEFFAIGVPDAAKQLPRKKKHLALQMVSLGGASPDTQQRIEWIKSSVLIKRFIFVRLIFQFI